MLNPYFTGRKIALLNILFLLLIGYHSRAQVYYHNFGTSAITTHPYTIAPPIIDSHLSGSSWTNSVGTWTSNPGAGATTAITMLTAPGTNTITLTFNVAGSYQLEVTSFDFWRQRSSIGPTAWSLAINGTNVGSGTTPTVGAPVGVTNVSTPITGLTGTVTVTLTLTGATGGNFRLDDFTLNGLVTSNCTAAVISSFLPISGPANTIVTINGTGFTNATAVKFNGINATSFTVVSNTIIKATVPTSATTGVITITANGCDGSSTGSFNVLTPSCTNNFSEIFISELYDQESGNGGMIEIYNPTATTIDLSSYVLQRYGNISDTTPTSGYILTLSGNLAPGATHLIASATPNPAICAAPTSNQTMGNGFNGNDKFELLKNGVVIDRVDVPFTGPGYTLIRKPNAIAPVPVYNVNDWNNTQHPNDVPGVPNTFCQNLGVHTITPTPIPTITHPVSATVCENGSTTYTVAVNPATGYTYQWKVLNASGTWINVTNNTNYSGATTNTLMLTQVPLSFDTNQYYCEITSSACLLVSNAAQLTVNPAPAVATATTTQPTCTTATGSITVTTPTGTGLTYSINGTTFQLGLTFNSLAPGSYNITVKNSNNCTSVSLPIVINPAPGAPPVATTTVTQPTCTTPTGTITVNTPTGTGFTYSIDGTTFQTATTFANLTPGSYTVTVNSGGCTSVTGAIIINAAPASPAVANTTLTQPTCTTPTGTITINTPTGAGLTYSIDGTNFQTGTTFANLIPGNYTVTVNSGGCTSVTGSITITTVPSAPAIANTTVTQPDCTTSTGTITINTPTGTGLTYSIDETNFQTGTTFANLTPGSYTVTVMNTAGCTSVTVPITINAAPATPAVATVTTTQPTCTLSTGTITVNVNTPTGAGITYSIDGTTYQAGTTFTNLNSGSYTVTVMNAAGCTSATSPIVINAAPAVPAVANTTVTQPTCTTSTGSITVNSPTGAGLTYSIDGTTFQTATLFANLTPGTYHITVQNASGCISVSSDIIINPVPTPPAVATVTVNQPSCIIPTGSITVDTPSGTGITYSINGTTFQSSAIFNGLASGTYHVTVKNASGCTSITPDIVINPAPPVPAVANVTVTQTTCLTTTGTITVNTPTGTGIAYSIDGINFQSSTTFSNLTPGNYQITVQNASGCTSQTATITINPVPAPPAVADVTVAHPQCTATTGSIIINSPLGTGLTYSINGTDYQPNPIFNNVLPGTYNVTVRATVDCTSLLTGVTVNNPPGGLPPISQPTPVELCDPNNDGFEYFDLTNTIQAIQNALGGVTVTIHETPQDAEFNVNPVPNTNQYLNLNYAGQTLYIRVSSNTTDCYDIVTVQLIVNPTPVATTPADYELCDDGASDTDGIATFNLSTKAAEIYGTLDPAQYSLAFYTDATNAAAGTNPITNPMSYSSGNATIWARVTNNVTGCYDVVDFDLIVNPLPVLLTNQHVYRLCETDDPVEVETFDLTTTTPVFIADQNGIDVSYYHTFADANAKTNPIPNPTAYQNGSPGAETIFVNITIEATGCYRIAFLDVDVDPEPVIQTPPTQDLTVCDTNGSGIGEFNLEALKTQMENGEPGLVIAFYESYQDALNGVNPIPNTTNYINATPYSHTIYAGVTNTISGCSSNNPVALTLTVEPAPQAPSLEDLVYCDDTDTNGQDGRKQVDLTVQNPVIAAALGMTIPTDIVVEYYTTEAAARAGVGRIVSETAYWASDDQQIWVRVESAVTGCFSVEDFFIRLNRPHALTTPSQLVKCDEALPNDAVATFDLTTKDNEILGASGQGQGYTVNYYITDPKPGGATPIADPTAYTNPGPQAVQTLYVEVITTEGCKSYTTLTIKVLPLPVPNFNPTPLEMCDSDATTGTEVFDLTQRANEIRANGSNYILSYYTTAQDAEAGTNPIADPTAYQSAGGEVYVRVELNSNNPSEPRCHQVVTLELIVNPLPPIADLDNIAHCQVNTTGSDVFNLTQEVNDILTAQGVDPANYDVDFFTDAALSTPAVPVNAYPVSGGSATIWIRIRDLVTGCEIVKEVDLLVEEAAIANPVTTTFNECDYDGANDGYITYWDLTLATPDILGSQNPADYSVTYYESEPDIDDPNAVNVPIANPEAYANTTAERQLIWAVVTNTSTVSGCKDKTSFYINVELLPEPVITGGTICVDKGTEAVVRPLLIDTGLDATHSFRWFLNGAELPDQVGPTLLAQEEGSYTVIATSATGCVSAESAAAVVLKSGSAVKVGRGYYVTNYFSDNQTITVTIEGYGVYQYSLDNGPWQDSNIFSNVAPGSHTVTVRDTNPNACDELVITDASIVDYPNFFTPNGDGFHDTWNIIGLQNTGSVIYIFDRYGKLIKQISPDSDGWDGTFNGVQVPATDYWFTVTYPEFDGTTTVIREFKSHFSLKR